jgi:uncharacterized protein YjaZ
MEFTVQDTLSAYREIIAEQNADKKNERFKEMLKPYEGMLNVFGGSLNPKQGQMDAMMLLQGWCFIPPQQLDEKALARLETFERYHAWDLMEDTMRKVCGAFKEYESRIPLKHILAGLFLLDPARMDPADHSYTGFGAIPGYVMVTYGEPDAYNMSRLQSTLAHEAHHSIYGAAVPRNMMASTVGEYMIVEGLAESFATSLFGKDRVGYYVEEFDTAKLPEVREGMKKALDLKGFDVVRSYIFGDRKAVKFGGKAVGMPEHAGYALGYYIAQDYLKNTGKTVVEAMFTPAAEIIRESKFFE